MARACGKGVGLKVYVLFTCGGVWCCALRRM